MPVEITNALSPLMQAISDARETVKKCEFDVEEKKSALKLSKATLEEAQGGLNLAVDAAIDAERQPTLFDRFGKDNDGGDEGGSGSGGGTPPEPPAPTPATPGTGLVVVVGSVKTVPVNHESVASLPVGTLAEKLARWRTLDAATELDIPTEIGDAFFVCGIVTLGDLADALIAGNTLNLKPEYVEELKDGIEQVSANDAEPITFAAIEEKKTKGKRGKKGAA